VSAVMPRFPNDDLVQPVERDPEALRGVNLTEAKRLQIFLQEDLSPGGIAGPSQPDSVD
jgi:hypothetical protein